MPLVNSSFFMVLVAYCYSKPYMYYCIVLTSLRVHVSLLGNKNIVSIVQ